MSAFHAACHTYTENGRTLPHARLVGHITNQWSRLTPKRMPPLRVTVRGRDEGMSFAMTTVPNRGAI